MELRANLWSSSTCRVLVRREGPSRKAEKKLPVRSKENQERGIIKAQKRKCFQEMVFNAGENSNKM